MRLPMPRLSRRARTLALMTGVPVLVAGAIAVPQLASAASGNSANSVSNAASSNSGSSNSGGGGGGGGGGGTTSSGWWVTFYGYTDNSPPGLQIADSTCQTPGGQTVNNAEYSGENGSYDDPVVVAWPPEESSSYCQIGYIPFLEKYVIHADECDPCGGQNSSHWDVWMGGDSNSTSQPEENALLSCENEWTTTTTIIQNAGSGEPTQTQPLFKPPTDCIGGTPAGSSPANPGASASGASGGA
jgi:hypothetical protein